MKIVAAKSILKANDQLAGETRNGFNARGLFCVNLVGSPGCGTTTLLESLFAAVRRKRVGPPAIRTILSIFSATISEYTINAGLMISAALSMR